MDLSNFKVIGEDSKNYHIEHPSGHKLIVSKDLMSDKAKGLIDKMDCGGRVGLDGGGSVGKSWIDSFEQGAAQIGQKVNNAFGSNAIPNDNRAESISGNDYNISDINHQLNNQSARQRKTYAGGDNNYVDGGVIGQNSVLAPDYNPNVAQTTPDPMQVPQESQSPMNPMVQKANDTEALLNKEQSNVQDLSAAQQAQAGQTAQAYKDYNNDESKLDDPNALYNKMKVNDDQLMEQYKSGSLDPNRYLNNMSTPAKISTGIALVLGGIGAGLTGGKNPAADFLQNAINQDIDSQKNDQSKKMNLWKLNRESYGDEEKANIATQNQLATGLQAKIAQAAAGAQGSQAKYNAEDAINKIEQQKIANRQRLSMYGQGQGGSNVNPLDMVSDPNIVPEVARQKVTDEIGKAQYIGKNRDSIIQLYDQAAKENTIAGRASRFGYQTPAMKALKNKIIPLTHDEVGRPNPEAVQAFEDVFPSPGERESTGLDNRQNFINHLNSFVQAPTARSYGINTENFKSTTTNPVIKLSAQEQQYYNFAKAHPSNPVSQDFFAKHPELK